MKKAISVFPLLIILLVTITSVIVATNISEAEADETLPIVQIIPSYCQVENISEPFSLNLTITNVTDLYGWEVKVYYLNTIVECTNITEGSFLKSENDTFWFPIVNNTYNATYGRIHVACSLKGMIPGVNGSGTLATLTFQAKSCGNTTLQLVDTKLADSNIPYHNPILHTTINGFVNCTEGHDIAVTGVLTSKTVIAEGFSLNITVTVENQGTRVDTFNVTTYANATTIETKEITLPSENSTTLIYTWNTTGWAKGNYTITAYATPVLHETDTTDNTFVDGWVVVTIHGDVDGDFDVDIYDVVKITGIYGSKRGDPQFNSNSDLDDDGEIKIYDVVMCTSHYGQKYP